MVVRRDQEQAKSEDVYTPAKLLSYQAYLKNTASWCMCMLVFLVWKPSLAGNFNATFILECHFYKGTLLYNNLKGLYSEEYYGRHGTES